LLQIGFQVSLFERIKKESQKILWRLYHLYLDAKMIRIRSKDQIRFLFIVQELSQWKTEALFKAMLSHPRFDPVLGVSPCLEYPGAEQKVIDYFSSKGYDFVLLDPNKRIIEQVSVDLVMHQKPYPRCINLLHRIHKNLTVPTVYTPYYLSTITESWLVNQRGCLLAWRQFIDSKECCEEWGKVQRLKGINYVVTGLPIMDELLSVKSNLKDIWPNHDMRKRVIYAPHHTVGDYHLEGISYSTFLEYGEYLLDLRDRYKDQVYFVFKPHPLLFQKLIDRYWGLEKTKAYYEAWDKPGYSHVEQNDNYISLFKYSDALIHDCGSFTIEYLYMGNPVMYLLRDSHHKDNLNRVASEAFDLHYKGESPDDIETFIQNVISGKDPYAERREAFCKRALVPPHGETACVNILNAILGEEEYK
jgi:hypothetical protein